MKKVLVTLGLALMLTTGNVAAETAGTVNGIEITVAEVNEVLNSLSKGKMTWEKLPEDGKKELIERMAPSKLVIAAAKKGLTDKEKEAAEKITILSDKVNSYIESKAVVSNNNPFDNKTNNSNEQVSDEDIENIEKQSYAAFVDERVRQP